MDIVVARYTEDLGWLDAFNGFNIFIYNKGRDGTGIKLDNIGREANTYLYHIVNNYNNLNDSCFLQGNPFHHYKDIKETVEGFNTDFKELGGLLKCDIHGNPHHGLDNLPLFISKLGLAVPKDLTFITGAQFLIKKELLYKYSYDFYLTAYNLTLGDGTSPYIFERLWYYMYKGDLNEEV